MSGGGAWHEARLTTKHNKNSSPGRRAALAGRVAAGSSRLRRRLRRTGARAEHGPEEAVDGLGKGLAGIFCGGKKNETRMTVLCEWSDGVPSIFPS